MPTSTMRASYAAATSGVAARTAPTAPTMASPRSEPQFITQSQQPSPVVSRGPIAAAATVAVGTADSDDLASDSSDDDHNVTPPMASPFTRVDGKGLWRSWKRNFKNKLLALLDLIDNSLDAAIVANDENEDDDEDEDLSDFIGRVHIYPDELPARRTPDASVSNSGAREANGNGRATSPYFDAPQPQRITSGNGAISTTTGLCIVNNCLRPVRPLVNVLEVYNSSKINSGSGDIGENGVGLKQGCATLSDLSFVLVKNGRDGYVELGMIAESLQRAEGCLLPAFRFTISNGDDTIQSLQNQMTALFSQSEHKRVSKCIQQYGSKMEGSAPDLQKGIVRLCKHFDGILNFFNNRFVFAVVLDDMHYGNPNDSAAADAIKDLVAAIPRTYLHVPAGFDFRIGKTRASREKVNFHYWPNRLVEFSSFSVGVNTSVPWHSPQASEGAYKLRVFAGFDRFRINDPDEGKACSLYIYSRESGRMIKFEPDARFLLSLNASGSMYCSGLTILIDDIEGKLPLNPTKQDVAFGEEMNGDIHKMNLFTWVGSVAKFFYEYHLNKFDKKKIELTSKINAFGTESVESELKVIDRCHLTTFRLCYKFYAKKSIRIEQNSSKENVGPDTYFHLVNDPAPARNPPSMTNGEPARKRQRIANGQEQLATHNNTQPWHVNVNSGNNTHMQMQVFNQPNAATSLAASIAAAHTSRGPLSNHHQGGPGQQLHTGQVTWPRNPQQHLKSYQQPYSHRPGHNNIPHQQTLPRPHQIPPQRTSPTHDQLAMQSSRPQVKHHVQQRAQQVRQQRSMPVMKQEHQRSSQEAAQASVRSAGLVVQPPSAGTNATRFNPLTGNIEIVPACKRENIDVIDLSIDEEDEGQPRLNENDTAATTVGRRAPLPPPLYVDPRVMEERKQAALAYAMGEDHRTGVSGGFAPLGGNLTGREKPDNARPEMTDPSDNEDDNDSVSSTKDYYKNLCEELMTKFEQKKDAYQQTKQENRCLKEEIIKLKKQLGNGVPIEE